MHNIYVFIACFKQYSLKILTIDIVSSEADSIFGNTKPIPKVPKIHEVNTYLEVNSLLGTDKS